MKNSPFLEVQNVAKIYQQKNSAQIKALDGINFDLSAGEFLVLVGPSGSGKTTLLNLIGALDRPTLGSISFEGRSLANLSNQELVQFRRKKIGFIFQTFNLLPSLTVRENIESALIHSTMSKNQIMNKIDSLLEFFGLMDKGTALPLELSIGQQQKVAIARAIVKDPVLLLADEPTGEMDPMAGEEIVSKLIELNRNSKVTILVVSHGAFPYGRADRTLFIRDGRIVSQMDAGY
jgi:ABC-type lipoprotein export system ATPase subunit